MRTDDNNNPIACTTDIAAQAGLVLGRDYEQGTQFPPRYRIVDGHSVTEPSSLFTARFLCDPIQTSIRVIDAVGYYTKGGAQRWDYAAMPKFVWGALTPTQKRDVVGFHYQHEGGTTMKGLFPNYGAK